MTIYKSSIFGIKILNIKRTILITNYKMLPGYIIIIYIDFTNGRTAYDNALINIYCDLPFSRNQSGKCTACGYERKDDKENCLRLPEMYILENRYIIGRILGNGGFGITYKAFDILNQCYCAVKEFVPLGVVKIIHHLYYFWNIRQLF